MWALNVWTLSWGFSGTGVVGVVTVTAVGVVAVVGVGTGAGAAVTGSSVAPPKPQPLPPSRGEQQSDWDSIGCPKLGRTNLLAVVPGFRTTTFPVSEGNLIHVGRQLRYAVHCSV